MASACKLCPLHGLMQEILFISTSDEIDKGWQRYTLQNACYAVSMSKLRTVGAGRTRLLLLATTSDTVKEVLLYWD